MTETIDKKSDSEILEIDTNDILNTTISEIKEIYLEDFDDDDEDIKKQKLEVKKIAIEEKNRQKEEKKRLKNNITLTTQTNTQTAFNIDNLPETHQKAFILKEEITRLYNEKVINIVAKMTKKKLILYDVRHASYQIVFNLDDEEDIDEIMEISEKITNPKKLKIYKTVCEQTGRALKSITEGKSYIRKYYDYTKKKGKGIIKRNITFGNISKIFLSLATLIISSILTL